MRRRRTPELRKETTMSEENKNPICPICGTEVPVNKTKGKKQGFSKTVKEFLGIAEAETEPPIEEKTEKDAFQNVSISPSQKTLAAKTEELLSHRFINRLIVLGISVCMLLLLFAPFTKISLTSGKKTYDLKFSGTNGIQLATVSMLLIEENSEYENMFLSDLASKAENSDTTEENLKLSLLLYSTSNKIGVSGGAFIATVLFIVYGILSLSLVIISAKDLLTELNALIKGGGGAEKHGADGLICMLFCLLPAVCYFLTQLFLYCAKVYYIDDSVAITGGLSFGAVLSIIVAALGTVFVCATNLTALRQKDRYYFNGEKLRGALCGLLIILIMISVTLPCISINVADKNLYENTAIQLDATDISPMPYDEVILYKWQDTAEVIEAHAYTALYDNNLPENLGEDIIKTLLVNPDTTSTYKLLDGIVAACGFVLFFSAFCLYGILRRCFFGIDSLSTVNTFKVFTFITVVINTIIVMSINFASSMFLNEMFYRIRIGVGFGAILMLVCAFLALIIPLKVKKQANKSDEKDYDDADVSYAPYIVKQ